MELRARARRGGLDVDRKAGVSDPYDLGRKNKAMQRGDLRCWFESEGAANVSNLDADMRSLGATTMTRLELAWLLFQDHWRQGREDRMRQRGGNENCS